MRESKDFGECWVLNELSSSQEYDPEPDRGTRIVTDSGLVAVTFNCAPLYFARFPYALVGNNVTI